MSLFVVRVTCRELGQFGFEFGTIAEAYVPVEAVDETEACKRAVLWHGDNGEAVEDADLIWTCNDSSRRVAFKATKCLKVTSDELDTFLSLTQGLTSSIVIGRE